MSNQSPTDPHEPWKPPQDPAGRQPGDPTTDPTPAAPVSGNPWSSPSGDALTPGPYQPPTYTPGYAPLPQPSEPEPIAPTAQFPQPPQPGNGHSFPPASQQAYAPPAGGQGFAPPPAGQGYAPPGGHSFAPPQPYGQAPYGPPQPGYGAPPPAPRKSNAPLIAVVLAVALLLCGGAVTAGVLALNSVKHRTEEALKPITDPTLPTEVPGLPTDLPDLPTDVPDLPTDVPTGLPQLPDPGASAKKITVEYEVTGDGPVSIIYTEKLGESPKRIENATLPWRLKTTMEGTTLVSVTAVRAGTDSGTISCRATVDGAEVANRTKEGTFATVSCMKMVF